MKKEYEQPTLTLLAIGDDVITSSVTCSGENVTFADVD